MSSNTASFIEMEVLFGLNKMGNAFSTSKEKRLIWMELSLM